jgi:hypothetical protein
MKGLIPNTPNTLDAVVTAIALGNLALLMLRLAHGASLSATALFRLKIASSGRGALAGTRWAHFNYNDKRRGGQPGKTSSEKVNITTKANKIHQEDKRLTTLSVPTLGSIGSSCDGGHE